MDAGATTQRGAAAVEFALSLLVLMPLLAGLVGLGGLYFAEMALINGIRAGGQYAQLYRCVGSGTCLPSVSSVVTSEIQHDLPDYAPGSNGSLTVSYFQACMDGSTPSAGACNSGSDSTPWNYVRVAVSYPFAVQMAGLIPGMPSSLNLNQNAVYRVN